MKTVNFKKSPVILLAAIFILGLTSLTTACEPDLFFGDLTICENINEETFEPINQKNEFDINIEKIYATIDYSGARGEDNYRFNWVNLDTGENILDKTLKYSEGKSSYFEGYAMSYIATNEEARVILPGNYKIEFYHNGELKSTANFVIEEPGIEIVEVSLANGVDENNAPANRTQQFIPTEIIYACVNINYYISGNSLRAKWYDSDGNLIIETINDLDVDLYEPVWIAFTLEGEGRNIPAGTYNVEIYLNNDLYGTYDFEVIKERQAAAGDDYFNLGESIYTGITGTMDLG
ncbi:MAG: hypothetical protein PHQ09_05345 [Actinomycetota bacterium]|nr:hypothetical protein [Actinomycetota bacterium]